MILKGIKYPSEFLVLAGQIFNDDHLKFDELFRAVKSNDDTKVRILIEEKMDSYEITPTPNLSHKGADDIVKNLIKASEVSQLYSQYMQLYEELVDGEQKV